VCDSTLEAAHPYVRRGMPVVPLPRGSRTEEGEPLSIEVAVSCRCPMKGLPSGGRRKCPYCWKVFMGHGWTGIDLHWPSKNCSGRKVYAAYPAFLDALCEDHRYGFRDSRQRCLDVVSNP
jgi:hypothetical protein